MLELEVTETVFLEQMAGSVERAFCTRRAEGGTIALDDFGTGYASLTHLQQFPVDVLKIDRSFISKLDGTKGPDLAIVQGVIDIARRMSIQTVAEGVENEAIRPVDTSSKRASQSVPLTHSPAETIRPAVLKYVHFPLSLRNVEDLLFERGIDICHETVRLW